MKIASAYIVCQNASMIRLNKRAPVIINMKNDSLSVGRREIKPVKRSQIVSLAMGLFATKCNSAQAIELILKQAGEFAVLIITDTPTVDQFQKLSAGKCIALKEQGLYQVYSENGNVMVKDENNRRVFRQGQSNIVPRTNPIEDPSKG